MLLHNNYEVEIGVEIRAFLNIPGIVSARIATKMMRSPTNFEKKYPPVFLYIVECCILIENN